MSVLRTAWECLRPLRVAGVLFAAASFAASDANAAVTKRLTFQATDVRIQELEGRSEVGIAGLTQFGGTDAPALPASIRTFVVPSGRIVADARVIVRDEVRVARGIRMGLRQAKLNDRDEVTRAFPQDALDPTSSSHPARPGISVPAGTAGGWLLHSVTVFPLRWDRATGDLWLARTIDIELDFAPGANRSDLVRERKGTEGERVMLESLAAIVDNPEDLQWTGSEGEAAGNGFTPRDLPSVEGSPVDMVIVTTPALSANFQTLADWKTKKGVPTVVKTLDWIDANYPAGHDQPERVRDFLRDAYSKWGTYLLLVGGDYGQVAPREAYNRFFFDGGTLIPTDQYFACLEGDWNADRDNLYGEGIFMTQGGDSADIYPDIFVGRASVDTPAEAATFVTKSLTYDKTPPAGYVKKVCYLAEVLFPDTWEYGQPPENITLDGGTLTNIFDTFVPVGWTRLKRYQSDNQLSRTIALNELNLGHHHLMTLMNHGDAFKFSAGNGLNARVYIDDTDALTNGNFLMFVMATACNPNQIDLECQGESLMNNPNGGAVAVMGPTREDFPVSAANFHEEMLRNCFTGGVTRYGVMGQVHRVPMAPFCATDMTPDRWTLLTKELLGDPELRFWTDEPAVLSVAHSASVPIGTASITVTVTSGGPPVADALVCVSDAFGTYARARTNASGVAVLPLSSSQTGTINVVASKREFKPKETTFTLGAAGGAVLALTTTTIDDNAVAPSSGNGNGVLDAGETIELGASVRNGGGATANGVTVAATVEAGTSATFDLLYDGVRDPAKVFIGPNRTNPGAVPFTLGFANPLIDYIGTPPMTFAADTTSGDLGIFLWQDDEGWHLRWASGATSVVTNGTVSTDGRVRGFTRPDLESTDTAAITATEDSLTFSGTTLVSDLYDGVDFALADNTKLTMVDGADSYGNITAGATVAGEVVFGIDATARDGQIGYIDLAFTSTLPATWNEVVPVVFAGPSLEAWMFDMDDTTNPPVSGDGDGVAEVGETVRLTPTVLNRGAGQADAVNGAATAGGGISFVDAADSYGNLAPLAQNDGSSGYVFTINNITGTTITLTLTDSRGRQWIKVMDFIAPAAPAGVTFNSTPTRIETIWDPNVESDIAGYNVYRSLTSGSGHTLQNFELLRTGTRFVEENLALGSGYYFYVTAVDESGNESVPSAEIFAYTTQPQIAGWPKSAGSSNVFSSPVMGNGDGAGANELYVGSHDFRMYAWEPDGSELPGYPVSTNAEIWGSPALADLDKNGDLEVLWGSMDSRFYVTDHDGTPFIGANTWIMDISGSGNTIRGTASVADVDGDSKLEFFFGTDNGRVYAFNDNGTGLTVGSGLFHQTANGAGQTGAPQVWGPLAIADWNADGTREIAFTCWNDSLFVKKPNGTNQAGFPKKLPMDMRNGPVFADLDADGTMELIVGCIDGKVYAFNHDGSNYLPGGVFATLPGEVRSQPAPCNLDGDPQLELVVSCFDGHMYAYNHNGTGFVAPSGRFANVDSTHASGGFSASPIVVDIDGNGDFEIFCGHRNGKFYGWHHTGALVVGMPIPTANEIFSSPCAGDLDGDGSVDVAFASYDATVNVIDFGGASTPAAYQWPMIGGNMWRTSSYGEQVPYQTSVEDPTVAAPLRFAMRQAEPNPFRSGTTIHFSLPKAGDAMLRVFNVEGRAIRTLVNGPMVAGQHATVWDGRDEHGQRLASGVYFYRLESEQGMITRKTTLLR